MKFAVSLAFVLFSSIFTLAQGGNELAPIVEKEIPYKDWKYKNVRTGEEMNLRRLTAGKKLVMVVYFAPWCPNWKHDLRFVQSLYEKYHSAGFDVIGVAEYDPVDLMKKHVEENKITFPVAWESDSRAARQTAYHYEARKLVGDTRNWGSPWYIFLEVGKLEPNGDVITKKAPVVNGELIEPEAEKFIREKLGLPPAAEVKLNSTAAVEICDPEKPSVSISKTADKKP
jgi:peroxiredoxin